MTYGPGSPSGWPPPDDSGTGHRRRSRRYADEEPSGRHALPETPRRARHGVDDHGPPGDPGSTGSRAGTAGDGSWAEPPAAAPRERAEPPGRPDRRSRHGESDPVVPRPRRPPDPPGDAPRRHWRPGSGGEPAEPAPRRARHAPAEERSPEDEPGLDFSGDSPLELDLSEPERAGRRRRRGPTPARGADTGREPGRRPGAPGPATDPGREPRPARRPGSAADTGRESGRRPGVPGPAADAGREPGSRRRPGDREGPSGAYGTPVAARPADEPPGRRAIVPGAGPAEPSGPAAAGPRRRPRAEPDGPPFPPRMRPPGGGAPSGPPFPPRMRPPGPPPGTGGAPPPASTGRAAVGPVSGPPVSGGPAPHGPGPRGPAPPGPVAGARARGAAPTTYGAPSSGVPARGAAPTTYGVPVSGGPPGTGADVPRGRGPVRSAAAVPGPGGPRLPPPATGRISPVPGPRPPLGPERPLGGAEGAAARASRHAVGHDGPGPSRRLLAGQSLGAGWVRVLAVIGLLALLAVCGYGGYLLLLDERGTAGASAGLSTSDDPNKRDISNQIRDPQPLTEAEVFPTKQIRPDPSQPAYTLVKTHKSDNCADAATDGLGAMLVGAGCTQVVRGTLLSPTKEYVLTTGIFNLRDEKGAVTAHDAIQPLLDARKGRFTGYAAGGATDVIARSATQLGWNYRGHYLTYCVIARADGKPVDAKDRQASKIIDDMVRLYLSETVIEHRVTLTSAPASPQ